MEFHVIFKDLISNIDHIIENIGIISLAYLNLKPFIAEFLVIIILLSVYDSIRQRKVNKVLGNKLVGSWPGY